MIKSPLRMSLTALRAFLGHETAHRLTDGRGIARRSDRRLQPPLLEIRGTASGRRGGFTGWRRHCAGRKDPHGHLDTLRDALEALPDRITTHRDERPEFTDVDDRAKP